MKVGITQRIENCIKTGERRDCLDQKWSAFLNRIGCMAVPLPNFQKIPAKKIVTELGLNAIILSGGNSIAELNPRAPDIAKDRDCFETELIELSLELDLPLLGVCRGMQLLNFHFGGRLGILTGHVATRHRIISITEKYTFPNEVNSFHNWGIAENELSKKLIALAKDENGNIEALKHPDKNVIGIMWHPEREDPFNHMDMDLFKRVLT